LQLDARNCFDRLGGERVPIAHRDKTMRVHAVRGELLLEGAGLLLGEAPDRRCSANRLIVMLYFLARVVEISLASALRADTGKENQ